MSTATTMALTELAEKGADVDMLRQMVKFMGQCLMELDVEARWGAGYDEKSPHRINSRNGYHDRPALSSRNRAARLRRLTAAPSGRGSWAPRAQAIGVVTQPVQPGGGQQPVGGEGLIPFVEVQVAGNDGGGLLVVLGDQVVHILVSRRTKRLQAE